MPQQITKDSVKKIANLAKLNLTEQEAEKYQKEFESILAFVDKIQKIDTKKVEPTYQVHDTCNIVREDKVVKTSKAIREKIIENFPDKSGDLLKVPPVL